MIDTLAVANALNGAMHVHAELTAAIGERPSGSGERVQSSSDPAAPLNLGVLDHAETIRQQLTGWAQTLEEESGLTAVYSPLPEMVRWMVGEAVWIAGAGWAPDMVDELRGSVRTAQGLMGQLPRRTRIPEACECGAEQWVVHERPPTVRCGRGHESAIVDHAAVGASGAFTVTQASRLTGIARGTIHLMIERGDVRAEGSPPMIAGADLVKLRGALAQDRDWR